MRVLVTGGAGFIGSHLCEFLLGQGAEVVCMDNLLTGNIENIAHLTDPRFSFVKHDVTNYIYVAGRLDYVLHFASPASPVDYAQLPIQTLKVGALGTHKALGLARESKLRPIRLYAWKSDNSGISKNRGRAWGPGHKYLL
jgi:dTDP-glucose 4,6-dehydratase